MGTETGGLGMGTVWLHTHWRVLKVVWWDCLRYSACPCVDSNLLTCCERGLPCNISGPEFCRIWHVSDHPPQTFTLFPHCFCIIIIWNVLQQFFIVYHACGMDNYLWFNLWCMREPASAPKIESCPHSINSINSRMVCSVLHGIPTRSKSVRAENALCTLYFRFKMNKVTNRAARSIIFLV